MTTGPLVRALLRGEPYFGAAMAALQGVPERHGYMRATVEFLARAGTVGPFRILEVGSWAGTSAVTWAKAMQEHYANGSVTCVDTWAPSFAPAVDRGTIYQTMREAAAKGDIYRLFLHNIRASGLFLAVDHLVGASEQVLPTLPPNHYQVVFLDGSHRHADVATDIQLGRRLVAEGGVLCGDDLELTLDMVDPDTHQAFLASGQDYALDPRTGRDYHPGVTQAVAEALPATARYAGFWAIRRSADGWQPIDLAGCDVSVPAHVREAWETDRGVAPPSLVGAADGFNIVHYRDRFVALATDLGSLDLSEERVGEREIAPRVLLGRSLDEIQAKIADASPALRTPEVRAVTTIDGYGVVTLDGRFVAVADELGPVEVGVERIGERDIGPLVLAGANLADIREKTARGRALLRRPVVDAVTTFHGYNVVRIDERLAAFAEELGAIDISKERLGGRAIPPLILVADTIEELRETAAESRRSLRPPQIALVGQIEGFNVVKLDGRFAAFAQALGTIDLTRERLGQRDIPPMILVGSTVDEIRRKIEASAPSTAVAPEPAPAASTPTRAGDPGEALASATRAANQPAFRNQRGKSGR